MHLPIAHRRGWLDMWQTVRTVIAAVVALAAAAGAAWLGWQLLEPRVATTAELGPEETITAFATALDETDSEALGDLVHRDSQRDLDAVLALLERVRGDLAARSVEVEVDGIEAAGPRANGTLAWTMEIPLLRTPLPPPDGSGETPVATATATDPPEDPATIDETTQLTWSGTIHAQERSSGWVVVPDVTLLHDALAGEDPSLVTVRRSTRDLGRASLLDVDGVALTNHTDLATIGFSPAQVTDPERALAAWAEVLPTSFDTFEEMLADESLNPNWFHPVVTLSGEQAERAWADLAGVPGLIRQTGTATADAATTFGTHVLGRVGLPTAEQVEEWGVPEGQPTGLTGLERVYDAELEAATTTRVELVDGDGQEAAELGEYGQAEGGPVTTSLEAPVQEAIEAALSGVTSEAAIVAVRTDGGIAGAASRPTTGWNRAFEARLAPGDAAAPITLLALAAAGVDGGTSVTCDEVATVLGARMEAQRPIPDTDLVTAIASGCDPVLAAAVRDHEPDVNGVVAALDAVAAPDLQVPTGSGTWPEPADATEAVRAGVGSGRVGMTPLQVATVAAEVAAEADLTPWLVLDDAVEPRPWAQDGSLARAVLETGRRRGGSAAGLVPDELLGQRPGWLGGLGGTGQATGDDAVHSWVVAVVGDLGVAVVVQDAEQRDLADDLARRFGRELAALSS